MPDFANYKESIILAFMCIISSVLIGQDQIFKFKSFSIADGLNTKTVYNFAQDKKGFIWLATGNGLYRSDGYSFKKMESPLDNYKNRIGSTCEIVKYENRYNKLYILSYSDIQYLDLNTYAFHRMPVKENKNVINEKYAFYPIDDKKIWYGGNGFLYELTEHQEERNLLNLLIGKPADASNNFANIQSFNKDELILTCTNYILFVNKNTYQVTRTIRADEGQHFLHCNYDQNQSFLWISAYHCLLGYDLKKNLKQVYRFTYLDNKNNKFNRIISTSTFLNHSELLLTNEIIFNTTTRKHHLVNEMYGSTAHNIKNEYSHFRDKDGNIWRGSIHQGCDVIIAKDKYTEIYGPLINEKGIYIEPYTSSLSKDNQKIYVAGSGISGYYQIDINSKKIEHILNPYNKGGKNTVNDILEYNGYIYTCDNNNIYKSKNGVFSKFINKNDSPPSAYSKVDQLEIWNDQLLAINNSELKIIDLNNGKCITYSFDEIDPEILNTTNPFFSPQLKSKDGSFYYSSNVGLYRQSKPEERPKKLNMVYKNEVINHSIINLAEDEQGKIWIGTLDYGVWILNPSDNEVHPLQPSAGIYAINGPNRLDILNENVYIGTQSAILVFETSTEKFQRALNKENGFFIDDAGYEIKNQNNQMLTINAYPYVITYKSDTVTNKRKNQITFTSLKISNKEMIDKPTNVIPTLKLLHPDNSFSLTFTDLNFFKNQYQIFQYRLLGLDTSWQVSNGNKIEYFRLPHGNYKLELAYIDKSTYEYPLSTIAISILPPFYKNAWFIFFILLSLVGVIYLWYRQKIKSHRIAYNLRNDYEKQLASLEMKALRAQMNPHFIFNSINSIQKFIFEKDDYDASQYLTKFSKLIRMILDQSNQDFASIGSEIEMLKLYLDMESLRFDHSFDYYFHIDENVSMDTKLPSMVIQPHVENAIWHGLQHKDEHGRLDISFQIKKDFLEVVIEDNGIGREKAIEYKSKSLLKTKSYGSKISEDRVRLFNRLDADMPIIQYIDKKNSVGESLGTKVVITISLVGNMNYFKNNSDD